MQSCYGKYWEGTSDSPCKDGKGCSDYSDCLAIFANGVLLKAQKTVRVSDGVELLSKAVGVSPESVLLAINFQNNAGIVPAYAPEPVKIETAKPKAKAEDKPIKKSNPRHPKHDDSRWHRERSRNPLIAKLTPGMKLTVRYKGVDTETVVRKGYYLCNGIKYPTLYAAMVSITGTKSYPKQLRPDGTRPSGTREMTMMSAVRFYKLKKKFEENQQRAKKKRS